ncbi:MAG TPA: sialidase family protein [Thermoanaerobaculia bacterium]|nr:sialidase family protein [Thermoanaerobaculia bacterium]
MRARRLLACLALAFGIAIPAAGQETASHRWPTLTEQLEAAEARPGTAFAALIAANQDFTILDADEVRDAVRIPFWLRVNWRRHHPEMVYSAADPTGGYPFVLKEVYEWMRSHQDLKVGPGDGEGEIELDDEEKSATVTGEVRISGAQTAPRSESDIRVNYWDPTKIIGASNNISGSGSQAQFYSTNGGTSWSQSSLAVQTGLGDAFHSDPTVDWTSDGTAWSTTIGINSAGSILRMRSYKSVDNGATWTFDATFSGSQSSTDKQIMWTDHSNSSPFKDNIYVCWHNGTPAFTNRRTGPGGSWQTAIQISGAESTGTAIGCDVKTNSFGDVFNFWPTTTNKRVFVTKSTNGGVSYGAKVQIAQMFDGFDIGVPSFNSRRALIYVSAGAYRTATKDLVYATWTDLTGAAGCTSSANEPGSNVASTCKTRIWFSRSTNGGTTWSAPVMINNQASLNDQYNQWMVVDETTGALSVIYYDTVADAGRKKSDVWYQSSFDDGASWFPAVKVTTAQTDETVAGADSGNQYGDYNGLSGYAGLFFPSWTDRRNAAREEIWTAKVSDPACTPPGTPAIGTASASGANQIDVTWGNGAPPATTFNVYRALGSCAAPGSFTIVGPGVAASPFNDGTVAAGTTYAYKVSGRDATGLCESPLSTCAEATTPALGNDIFSNGFEGGVLPGPWSGVLP